VYSIGAVQPLPQGPSRWESTQALVKVIAATELDGIIKTDNKTFAEALPWISVKDDIDVSKFKLQIVTALLKNPPNELVWLKGHAKHEIIFKAITCPNFDPINLPLPEEHFHDVLSLRGLLSFDILLHCLKKRHRVDYGVKENGRKRLAVPFRGADTPSERAEFSHPDCAIVLTLLSYYDRGLSKNDVKKAFELLLGKGKNSRASIYNDWITLSKKRMPQDVIF